MAGPQKNLKILKYIGIDEWFMYSEKFQPFFGWFGENITDATIFKESDLSEYDDLKEENLVLSDTALERERTRYETELSIIQNGNHEIKRLLADIELATQAEKAIDKLTSDMKNTNTKVRHKLSSAQLISKRLKSEEEAILSECMLKSKEVQDEQQENISRMKDVYRFYSTEHLNPVFIHQMGLCESYQHCDSFVKHLDLYMDNNFKLEHTSDLEFHDESGSEQAIVDLDKIKMKMFISSQELCRQNMLLSAQKSLNSAIQGDWPVLSMLALDKEAMEMHRQNEDYYKVQTEAALDSLKFVLRQMANLEVETAAFENTRAKLDRAKERLQQMESINSVVSDDLMIAEVLWLLMQFDMEKLRQRSQWNILDQYQTENRAALRRIEIMKLAQRTTSDTLTELHLSPLSALAHLNETGDVNPLGLYDKLLQCVRDNMGCLGNKKSERVVVQFLDDLRGQETRLRKFVQNGPVSNIVLCDLDMKNSLFTIKSALKQIEYKITEFKANYIKQYTEPMNNNRFWQFKQLLWIWFLTEPKIVVKAIKSIQAAAKDAARQRPTKTVSGIKRRE